MVLYCKRIITDTFLYESLKNMLAIGLTLLINVNYTFDPVLLHYGGLDFFFLLSAIWVKKVRCVITTMHSTGMLT